MSATDADTLTPAAALRHARDLRPRLIEEAAATEARTVYSPELHEELRRAGMYRMLMPRRYGGCEFDVPSFLAVVTEMARGDMSAAWAFCLGAGHALQVGSWFPEATQEDVFRNGHFVCPSTIVPGGSATRAGDGAWLLTTRHPYCSGSPYSTHYLGQAIEFSSDGPVQPVVFVAPRDTYTVLDDWGDTLGLKGSGSNSIVFDNARIPARNVIEGQLAVEFDVSGGTAGYELHGNPMYLGRAVSFFSLELAALVVGGALGALDEYERLAHARTTTGRPPVTSRTESADYQRWFGRAAARINSAQAITQHTATLWMSYGERAAAGGEPFSAQEDAMLDMMTFEAIRIAWDALQDTLFCTAGSSAARHGERLERCFRDVAQAWGHVNTIIQAQLERDWSRMAFGLPVV